MPNLATALQAASDRRGPILDIDGARLSQAEALTIAARTAALLQRHGAGSGSRVALCADNSLAFVVAWLAAVLAGAEVALVNPAYPPRLLRFLLGLARPAVVLSDHPAGVPAIGGDLDATVWDIRELVDGSCHIAGTRTTLPPRIAFDPAGGEARDGADIAGYMHTSGSTGWPKFCAQSHAYYLNLAQFAAEALRLEPGRVVYNPLPLHHVNPLGYCLLPALLNGCHFVADARFSATQYWTRVRQTAATTLVLHEPLVRFLKKQGPPAAPAGGVRLAFLADTGFQRMFGIPETIGAYGSTEAGGLTSYSRWRLDELPAHPPPEGTSCVVGGIRDGIALTQAHDGEMVVREREPGHLASYYLTDAGQVPLCDEDGAFHTGDVARRDPDHGLVFVGRRDQSIRIKGEYVPIPYVEEVLEELPGVSDAAVGLEGTGENARLVAYLHSEALPDQADVRDAMAPLPRFMRPAVARRVRAIPRTAGVGKVARTELAQLDVLDDAEWSF